MTYWLVPFVRHGSADGSLWAPLHAEPRGLAVLDEANLDVMIACVIMLPLKLKMCFLRPKLSYSLSCVLSVYLFFLSCSLCRPRRQHQHPGLLGLCPLLGRRQSGDGRTRGRYRRQSLDVPPPPGREPLLFPPTSTRGQGGGGVEERIVDRWK